MLPLNSKEAADDLTIVTIEAISQSAYVMDGLQELDKGMQRRAMYNRMESDFTVNGKRKGADKITHVNTRPVQKKKGRKKR